MKKVKPMEEILAAPREVLIALEMYIATRDSRVLIAGRIKASLDKPLAWPAIDRLIDYAFLEGALRETIRVAGYSPGDALKYTVYLNDNGARRVEPLQWGKILAHQTAE